MILFSHRPKLGVSVAAVAENGRLKLSIATTHSRLDVFSRDRARKILKGRLSASPDEIYMTHLTVHDFMNAFKAWFKPTPDESDPTFPRKISKRRSKIREMILCKAQEIIYEECPF